MSTVVNFIGYRCSVELAKYKNGRLALQLVAAEADAERGLFKGEPIAMATINIPEIALNANEVIIKDYSENEGMLEVLQEAGIVSDPIEFIQTGFVTVPVVALLPEFIEANEVA